MNKPKRLIVLFVPLFAFIFIYGAMFYCPPDIAKSATVEVTNCDPNMPDTVVGLQQFLNDSFGAGLTVDGKFGNQTYKALQRFYELKECDQYARKEFE